MPESAAGAYVPKTTMHEEIASSQTLAELHQSSVPTWLLYHTPEALLTSTPARGVTSHWPEDI